MHDFPINFPTLPCSLLPMEAGGWGSSSELRIRCITEGLILELALCPTILDPDKCILWLGTSTGMANNGLWLCRLLAVGWKRESVKSCGRTSYKRRYWGFRAREDEKESCHSQNAGEVPHIHSNLSACQKFLPNDGDSGAPSHGTKGRVHIEKHRILRKKAIIRTVDTICGCSLPIACTYPIYTHFSR